MIPTRAPTGTPVDDFWVQTTGGQYDVEAYGVYDLLVSPKVAKLIQ